MKLLNFLSKKVKPSTLFFRIILFLLISHTSIAQEYTFIPDENFEQALIDFGFDSNPIIDHQILTDEINTIEELNLQFYGISSLEGIQDFISLKALFCEDNLVTEVDLSMLTNLELVFITNNLLTSINVSGLSNLQMLELYGNNLADINLSGLTSLIDLQLGDNNFDSIDVSHLTTLAYLGLGGNNLSTIDISTLVNLGAFGCENNQISNLNFNGLSQLESVSCGDNLLTELDVSQLTNLNNLQCQNNFLTSLDLTFCPNLLGLNCKNNQLTSLNLCSSSIFYVIDCSNNFLSSLDLRSIQNWPTINYRWDFRNNNINKIYVTNTATAISNNYIRKDITAVYSSEIAFGGNASSNQTICFGTKPNDLNLTGNSGSVIKWQKSTNIDFSSNVTDIINTTNSLTGVEIGNLTSNTYFRAVVESGICVPIAYSNVVEILIGGSSVWDGNFWSNGEPDSTKDIIFSEDKILTSDLIACSCHINNSANVIVGSGIDLTIVNNLSVDSGSSLIVENNANLIQINDVTNSGNIIVNRNSAPIVRLDHTLWSTPVTGQQTLQQFSPQTLSNRFYVYNTVSNSFSPIGMTSTFPLAKAIGIRAPNNWGTNPSEWSGSFVGTPNNGNILYSVSTVGYNGVGNPYPSTIDGSTFISANSDKITGTLYFYAHTLSMNSVGVFPSGTNYATWNPGMGGTPASVGSGGTGSSPVIPNGIIQVGQGFFVKATQLGDLSFTNSMRIGNSDNQFFRTSSTSSISSTEYNIERHRIWLNLSNPTNPLNTILVGYAAGATNDIDNGFDGLSFGSAGSYLYSVLNNSNYTIQGRALPFLIDDEVSLGFKASEAGVFTISIYDVDGLFDGSQDIFIKDLQLETITNIKNNSYTFTSDVGTFDNRFKIVYKEPQLSSDLFLNENNVLLYMNYETLFIKSNISLISKVIVSDIQGRVIYEKGDINNSNFQTDAIKATDQVVLVKIFSQNGSIFTKKIML
ncbi:MAG: hypothetical protein RSE15_06355 [Flavobacterium sp.]|uniref:hypothetical protein n=1 Tax=Flavobacterium sp. TaxID=239 RepID=UPI002B471DAD|nr:hypothetical protein [Flavobacterium sp.]WRH74437.1 MAG: hypothetical protein RSE15_06355 [Flavobacterium sp.]